MLILFLMFIMYNMKLIITTTMILRSKDMSLYSNYVKQYGNTIVLNKFNSELSKYCYIIFHNVTKYV